MPLAFLFTGGIPWRLIGIVVGAISIAACSLGFAHISRLESQLDTVSRIANDNAVMAEDARLAMDRANTIAAQVAQNANVTHRKFSERRRKAVDAPPTDDGPLAPVLRRVLDGLSGENGDEVGSNANASATGKSDHVSRWPSSP